MNLVPGRFYHSAAGEVWCCFVAHDDRRFGVVRIRDGRTSTVDPAGRGENLLLISRAFSQNCACGREF